ncbi:MAG: GNAT family N-acetyltransferase [Oscillospiraceae bacterium]|nr:GNAT family N-acetyltransferase [Oscillospiraceae bacterium]
MTRIYLIRHGEAEGNLYRRAQGHYEADITAKGHRQIAALAERFRDVHLDALYSSDLRRTQITAGAITKYHDLKLNLEPQLREVCLGQWEDEPWGNLSYDYPEAMTAFNDDPEAWSAPGAESFGDLKKRMVSAILRLAAAHDGQTIACVSHGMAIRTLLSHIFNVPSSNIRSIPHGDNTAVSLLEVEGEEIKAVFYNDASHLEGELSTFARQKWWRKPGLHDADNVRFCLLDPNKQPELYLDFYSEAWQAVHGSLEGFEPEIYLSSARRHYKEDGRSIAVIMRGDETVGLTELDTRRGKAGGYGWICLCCVKEAHRRSLLGVQLLGHAVSVFRRLGYKSIRLSVFPENTAAVKFYTENGFKKIGSSEGCVGALDVMEKLI